MDCTSWDETPLEFPESFTTTIKMTSVRNERKFTGALNGKGKLDIITFKEPLYLIRQSSFAGVAFYKMVYHPNDSTDKHAGTATFTGLMYYDGEIEGKGKGTIVFKSTGTYGSEGAICEWESDPKTGTDGLAGLSAKGGYTAKGMTGQEVWISINA